MNTTPVNIFQGDLCFLCSNITIWFIFCLELSCNLQIIKFRTAAYPGIFHFPFICAYLLSSWLQYFPLFIFSQQFISLIPDLLSNSSKPFLNSNQPSQLAPLLSFKMLYGNSTNFLQYSIVVYCFFATELIEYDFRFYFKPELCICVHCH